jgi:putative DNA primase/helicase
MTLPDSRQKSASGISTRVCAIEDALSFIPAEDRDIWIKCGMAIKGELGQAGFDIWDRWSATSDKYQVREAEVTWQSFKRVRRCNDRYPVSHC